MSDEQKYEIIRACPECGLGFSQDDDGDFRTTIWLLGDHRKKAHPGSTYVITSAPPDPPERPSQMRPEWPAPGGIPTPGKPGYRTYEIPPETKKNDPPRE